VLGGGEVRFSWEVTPRTDLYHRTEFRVSFPRSVDVTAVPPALWWRIALICLHPHWALLRPCRVELPIRLGAGEREFWMRLIEAAIVNLVEYGSVAPPGRAVDLVESGPALPPVAIEIASERVAAAFSGGKDSLAQSALLAELTDRPLLVTTTDPVPWANDHLGAARQRTLAEISRRLPVDLVEVHSDFRSCWDNGFGARDGGTITVNELSDVLLYQAVTVAVAAASGISRAFLASEADLQYNTSCPGGILQHSHFASSMVTLASLDSLLGQFGLHLGSVTCALHTPQVVELLWRRYPELIDLQFSCWLGAGGAQACSACGQCLEVALLALANGLSPSRVGIDPVVVMCSKAGWRPDQPGPHPLHETRVARHHAWRALEAVPVERFVEILDEDPRARGDPRLGEAIAAYRGFCERAAPLDVPPAPGYIEGFLELIDSRLRGPLRAIIDDYFEPAPVPEFAATVARSRALTARISAPLAPRARPARVG
jgi:hypothetical protein